MQQKCALGVWGRCAADMAGWVQAFVAVAQSTSAFGINPLN